jgi:type I restriction-modification system DNA methylase subunit
MSGYRPENRNLFSDTYLETQYAEDFAPLEKESRAAFRTLSELRKQSRPERFGAGREQQLREEYLDKVLDVLGWARTSEGRIPSDGKPDYALFRDQADKDAALSHIGAIEFFRDSIGLCEAKPWGVDLHKATSEGRSPRGQIYGYLEDTHLDWGFATNGKEWMLVWRGYSRAQQRDFTVDLDALLLRDDWSPEFNYFYGFFSRAALADGLTQRALERSRLSGEAVGQNLKSNVYEALLTLGRSIYVRHRSDFGDADQLSKLKADCLIFLYRLLFVNYAESRRLLPMQDSDLYRRSFSLLRVKEAVQEAVPQMRPEEYLAISDESSNYLRNIRKLFKAIDTGLPMAHIPPYNGGLFRAGDHPFLDSIEIDDRTVAQVVDLLSRTRADPERFVDYSYLGVRELGSIYEGLLEYHFRIAEQDMVALSGQKVGTEIWLPRGADQGDAAGVARAKIGQGDLYLATAKGERKASGSFYTPDEIVKYIVRESLSSVVEKRIQDAQTRGEDPQLAILNLKVLDPAMGSGHFLVAATEFLAEKLLDSGEERVARSGLDSGEYELEAWAKRQVASHCIYGVDLNPMAVELAKVSLWLTTFSRGQPLTFLDHRLKIGNSLLGSRLEELAVFPRTDRPAERATRGKRSVAKPFDITGLVEEFRSPIEAIDSIDEAAVADVERKKELYLAFLRSPRYGRIVALANGHAAFRYSPPSDTEVATKVWAGLVRAAVDAEGMGWARASEERALTDGTQFASVRTPFHWDLEFPEVFGRASPGFDAVIGNPPYVRIYRGQLSEEDVAFFQRRFRAAHMKFDLYVLFLELGIGLLRRGGRLGFIVPDKFATAPYGEPVRRLILRNRLVEVLDLRAEKVFSGVAVAPLIVVIEAGEPRENETVILAPETGIGDLDSLKVVARTDQKAFSGFPQSQIRIDASFSGLELLSKLSRNSFPLSKAYYVNWGLRTGTEEKTARLISATSQGTYPRPLLRGEDIRERYVLERPPRFIDYDRTQLYNPMFPELFESPKIVFRKISGPEGLRAVLDETGAYCFSTLICAVNLVSIKGVKRPGVAPPTREAKRFRDPGLVLAISNSKLVSWWYAQSHSDKLGVNPGHVQSIPLPASLLEVPVLKVAPTNSDFLAAPLEGMKPELLEAVVSKGGRRLQMLGDSIVIEARTFCKWLTRELGPQIGNLYPNKVVERVETTDEAEFIYALEGLHRTQPLRRDPRLLATQETVLTEYRALRARIAGSRREMGKLDSRVERCIHLLFGLTGDESARIG